MATKLIHRRVPIFTLADGETIAATCTANSIALVRDDAGWWTCFVGEDGAVERYDEPFPSQEQALWSAKAAAEFGI
ncbi:hypothetical protein E4L96_05595 [Massilia arenosa]|uniref:Uncharacterized protein n=1 Tax=Zemynaea arenosa TaxID=2561931 RepID=A0A4Y9SLN8_9BURK|nr:hypothetical protein [Massilia arenosa]TFW25203.1 hypothetical protein E4L96_05595 [Massilia arenosa]